MDHHPLLRLVEAAFAWLARLRRARAFHPRGGAGAATLSVEDPTSVLAATVGAGDHAARVRLSRGVGLPEGWPDFLGIAVRIQAPEDCDLLFTSVGPGPLSRVVLPARSWTSPRFSTVQPHAAPDGRVTLELEPLEGEPFTLRLVERRGRRRAVVGRLALTGLCSDAPVAFDPVVHAHPRLRPVRFGSGLRAAAYAGSRRGRARAGDQGEGSVSFSPPPGGPRSHA